MKRGGKIYKAIADLKVEQLSAAKMTTVKECEYLNDTAKRIADGTLTKEQLLQAGDVKQAEKRLVANLRHRPVDRSLCADALPMPSAFPIDDVGLHNSIKHVLGLEAKPTKTHNLVLSAGWSLWESYGHIGVVLACEDNEIFANELDYLNPNATILAK